MPEYNSMILINNSNTVYLIMNHKNQGYMDLPNNICISTKLQTKQYSTVADTLSYFTRTDLRKRDD